MMTMLLNTIKKCKPIIVVICLSLTVFSFAQQKEKSKFFELDNGLKVYLYERHILPLLNITVAVNLGSKDETEETNGTIFVLRIDNAYDLFNTLDLNMIVFEFDGEIECR